MTVFPVNDALVGRPAFQSSTWTDDPANAGLAVDGQPLGYYYGQFSCSHTQEEVRPWLLVDIGETVYVTGVILTNRRDCCGRFNIDYRYSETCLYRPLT